MVACVHFAVQVCTVAGTSVTEVETFGVIWESMLIAKELRVKSEICVAALSSGSRAQTRRLLQDLVLTTEHLAVYQN